MSYLFARWSLWLCVSASFDTLAAAHKDALILAKMHFYAAVARTFSPFMKSYQTDEPVLPFFARDLAELMMVIISCAVFCHLQYKDTRSFIVIAVELCKENDFSPHREQSR